MNTSYEQAEDGAGPSFIGSKCMVTFAGRGRELILMSTQTGKTFTVDQSDIDAFCEWISAVQNIREEMLP